MARKKRKEIAEEHASEAWLIPYADILTLLLALFIVLFAVSQTDQKKVAEMAQAFSAAFHTGGPSMFNGNGPETSPSATMPIDAENQAYMRENQQLVEVKQSMDEYIEQNGLQGELSTELTEDGLSIRIRDKVLFPSGSATLLERSKQIGKTIAKLLGTVTQKIIISGHTDNVPIANSQYPSNWDLSAARSLNFMKFILTQEALDPSRFSTVAYGEYRPISENSNATEEGRAENRRVEILIARAQHDTQQQKLQ